MADAEGSDALARHPDADVNDAVNRGLAALYRTLVRTRGDQRYLSSQAISTVAGTTSYTLSTSAMHIISVEGTVNGSRIWFDAFQPEEYPLLSDTSAGWSGQPFRYALRGATDIVFLPVPQSVYTINVWFVPVPSTLASDSDTFDTIARLDDFIVAYAARELAMKDKAWELVAALKGKLEEMRADVEAIARQRDQNAPGRIIDEGLHGRNGRLVARGKRFA
jgi:hypothetical protein